MEMYLLTSGMVLTYCMQQGVADYSVFVNFCSQEGF